VQHFRTLGPLATVIEICFLLRVKTEYSIGLASSADDLRAVAKLFEAYASSLPIDLAYQNFAAEVAGLPGDYAPPDGALFLARDGEGVPMGCVGLRRLADKRWGEMKRLYLLPAARGLGLGHALAMAVVNEARRLGYDEIRLDTLPTMRTAQSLYGRLGFKRIASYYNPTPPGTVFMALKL
jgi:ribosomal protein S18 acetylase RimI-like enzyme